MPGKKILLIDDDLPFLALMEEILVIHGYTFYGFSYTDDIVSLVKATGTDLVLLDYRLIGINGGELCRALHDCPETTHLPVMILSAYTASQLPLEDIPCSVFIPKPFDLWDFLACVKELLSQRSIKHSA